MSRVYVADFSYKTGSNCDSKSIASRVKALRKSLGIELRQPFADMLGVSVGRYNHWETGRQIIPVEYAAEVCAMTGATLDYIYLGKHSYLPLDLIVKLRISLNASQSTPINS